MKVTICIGSSCHIKGSKAVVESLQQLIKDNGLENKVELSGTLCLGHCKEGVSVMVDDVFHSVSPENAALFFEKEIRAKC
ncbi:(2Fe-2S) ferredoxin domain-containing protein [Butyrivibrio sp. MC2013]|uniref:(2Fe-2S) ferredoxin domain-containing protein n=1 Tax=Butyrivibrio sp. MC2013 TaxID=1280686 RepID=UPI00041CB10C|nr:(2Fe-2S) ferredoxin domain-containing protein [Butyrivibrio sp. MC2013]